MIKIAHLFDEPEETSNVITVEEAAKLSGLSVATVRRRCANGEIAASKAGTQWLISADDFTPTRQPRKRAHKKDQPLYDFKGALRYVRRTDMSELWVPDVLRYQDAIDDSATAIAEAERRLERNSFGSPVRIAVPKSLYSNRPGTILEFPDRVAYQAVVSTFADKLDANLRPCVFSSRLSRDSNYFFTRGSDNMKKFKNALPAVAAELGGDVWVASTDITGYFDNILHDKLFNSLAHAGVSGQALKSLRVMLSTWSQVEGMGLPQGPNASRLLGNFYLSQVDDAMCDIEGVEYLRYMDDVRIIARTKPAAVAALHTFEALCRDLGLTVSSAKTFVDTYEGYKKKDKDGLLDRIASLFDHNRITLSRPKLKKLLQDAIGENSVNVRHAKFSLWRLTRIRELSTLSSVLRHLEILAPTASTAAAYLERFANRKHVQRKLAEFLSDPTRSYSPFLRTWLYAAIFEIDEVPNELRRLAELDARDLNNPYYLRAVAVAVLGRAKLPRDVEWMRQCARHERDPEMARALLMALACAKSLDGTTSRVVSERHSEARVTAQWLKGRSRLPSMLDRKREVRLH